MLYPVTDTISNNLNLFYEPLEVLIHEDGILHLLFLYIVSEYGILPNTHCGMGYKCCLLGWMWC